MKNGILALGAVLALEGCGASPHIDGVLSGEPSGRIAKGYVTRGLMTQMGARHPGRQPDPHEFIDCDEDPIAALERAQNQVCSPFQPQNPGCEPEIVQAITRNIKDAQGNIAFSYSCAQAVCNILGNVNEEDDGAASNHLSNDSPASEALIDRWVQREQLIKSRKGRKFDPGRKKSLQ